MAERGNATMTEWLDIKLDTLSAEERLDLIEEILDALTPQELHTVRDVVEQKRKMKLEDAKAAVLEEMSEKLSVIGLTLKDVFPSRLVRKGKTVLRVKYRSPDGELWSGRGKVPLWLRQLELQGHKKEEYAVTEG
jgi:DNA-binding protein H-NS